MRRTALLALAGVATIACAHAAADKSEPERRYVQSLYNNSDTETFTRDAKHITGTIVNRHETIKYRAALGPDGFITVIDLTAMSRGEAIRIMYPVPKGVMGLVPGSTACLEQLLRRARIAGGDSISIPTMFVGRNPETSIMTVVGNGPDSLMLLDKTGDPTNAFHVAVDSTWHILGGTIPLDGLKIESL